MGSTKVSHSVEMEILYDFLDFQEKIKKHLITVAPLRSQKRKEELINNFYHNRPDSAISSVSSQ